LYRLQHQKNFWSNLKKIVFAQKYDEIRRLGGTTILFTEYKYLKKSCTQFSSFVPAYIVVHPNFNALTMENDFAIITLRDPVYFTTSMSPICLPLSSGSAHENK
jgi:hypothetical protein